MLSVGIAYVLYRKERNQRLADRAAATEERERERRNALVDVRLVSQRQPQTTTTSGTVSNWPETWFRISVVGGNIDTWVYLKRVAWRVDEDHWEELVGDEPPYIRLAAGQMQHVAPRKPVIANPCEVEITWLIDNETHGRKQSVVVEPWT